MTGGAFRGKGLPEHQGLVGEPGKDFASCSGRMGPIDCLTPEIWSGLCCRKFPWLLYEESVLGEQVQKPAGELEGSSSGQERIPSRAGESRCSQKDAILSFMGPHSASVRVHRWGSEIYEGHDWTRGTRSEGLHKDVEESLCYGTYSIYFVEIIGCLGF